MRQIVNFAIRLENYRRNQQRNEKSFKINQKQHSIKIECNDDSVCLPDRLPHCPFIYLISIYLLIKKNYFDFYFFSFCVRWKEKSLNTSFATLRSIGRVLCSFFFFITVPLQVDTTTRSLDVRLWRSCRTTTVCVSSLQFL